jgi:hypothetical protein
MVAFATRCTKCANDLNIGALNMLAGDVAVFPPGDFDHARRRAKRTGCKMFGVQSK